MCGVVGEWVPLVLIKLVSECFSERWGPYGIETDLPVWGAAILHHSCVPGGGGAGRSAEAAQPSCMLTFMKSSSRYTKGCPVGIQSKFPSTGPLLHPKELPCAPPSLSCLQGQWVCLSKDEVLRWA